jgi:hypothetical protein
MNKFIIVFFLLFGTAFLTLAETKNDSLRVYIGLNSGVQLTKIYFEYGLLIMDHSQDKHYSRPFYGFEIGVKPLRHLTINAFHSVNQIYYTTVGKPKDLSNNYNQNLELGLKIQSIGIGLAYVFTNKCFFSEIGGFVNKNFVKNLSLQRKPEIDFFTFKLRPILGVNLNHHVIAVDTYFSYNLNQNLKPWKANYNSFISFSRSYGVGLLYRYYFLKK